jgi:DNA modification methylase
VTWDDADANTDLYDTFIAVAVEHAIAQNAAWYCWHASRRQAMLESAWNRHGAFVHCQIIWAKNRPVLTRTWYAWQHQPCLMGWLQGHKPPRAERDVLSTVWHIDTIPNGAERPEHPTPKPLEVFEIPMRQHTRGGTPGDVCYEPFAGSGTQIIAAENLGRRCFALEVSPHYCDLIVRRWIHAVGLARAPRNLVERYALPPTSAAGPRSGRKAVSA